MLNKIGSTKQFEYVSLDIKVQILKFKEGPYFLMADYPFLGHFFEKKRV